MSLEKDSDSGSDTDSDSDDEEVKEDSANEWRPRGKVTKNDDDKPVPSSPTV